MPSNVELRRLDPKASLPKVVAALNTLIDRDLGNDGGQLKHYGYDGNRQQTVSSDGVSAGAVTSSGNYTHDVHSAHASGLLAAFRLPATTKAAAPTVSNCAALVQAVGVLIGAGKALRVYAADGTDYVSLTSDADGGMVLGGSGANSGILSVSKLIAATIGPNATQQHTLPAVASDTVALLAATQTLSAKTVSLVDGAAATPSVRFDNDTDTGLYRVTTTTGRLGVACDGTQVAEFVSNGSTLGMGLGVAPSVLLTAARNVADYLASFTNANSRGLGVSVVTGGTNAADRLLGLFSNTSTDRFSVYADGAIMAGGVSLTPALGSWTPVLASTGATTYTTQTGNYIKIGRLVVAWCQLQIDTKDGAASANSITLPFTADNNASGAVDTWGTLSATVDQISVVTSGANAVLVGTTAAATASGTLSVLQSGSLVRFTVCYRTAS